MAGSDAVMEFLLTRRSRPAKLLAPPGPDRDEIGRMLAAAGRVPDHGKLEPWRFVVLTGGACGRFAAAIRARAALTGNDADKGALAFEQAPVAVAVVAVPRDSAKIPAIEQTLSVGAAALSLLNAALASGWGANWLTGWPAYDATLLADELEVEPGEWVAGFVHVGTCPVEVPDRPRPDIEAITTWLEP